MPEWPGFVRDATVLRSWLPKLQVGVPLSLFPMVDTQLTIPLWFT